MATGDPRQLYEAAQQAFRAGRAAEARRLLEEARARAPDALPVLMGLVHVCAAAGDHGAAYDHAAAAARLAPDDPRIGLALGNAAMGAGRFADAAAAYRRMLERAPDADAAINLGIALHELGRYDEAVAAYRAAPHEAAGQALYHYNLGNALKAAGDGAAAEASYRRALDRDARFAPAHHNLGLVLEAAERPAEAADHYAEAARLDPGRDETRINQANALANAGRRDEAVAVLEDLVARRPDFATAHYNLASALLEAGRAADALAACDRFDRDRHAHCGIVACRAIALDALGRHEEAARLNDFDRLVRPVAIAAPDGFANADAFNAALRAHILGHPTLRRDPHGHATRHGEHTGELLAEPWGPMRAMQAIIEREVAAYLAALPDDSGHPYLADKPARWRLTAWSVVMGAAGHQVPHIHPAAWVSGVYYVEVPDAVRADDPEREGWIEFGRPGAEFALDAAPATRAYRPEPGLMVLFPAYMYHRTIPYRADARRISLAFDAVAAS